MSQNTNQSKKDKFLLVKRANADRDERELGERFIILNHVFTTRPCCRICFWHARVTQGRRSDVCTLRPPSASGEWPEIANTRACCTSFTCIDADGCPGYQPLRKYSHDAN